MTGVYVFDTWVRKTRLKFGPLAIKIALQYHDEILFWCLKELKTPIEEALKTAMIETNEDIKLNVNIKIDTQWGNNYAEVH